MEFWITLPNDIPMSGSPKKMSTAQVCWYVDVEEWYLINRGSCDTAYGMDANWETMDSPHLVPIVNLFQGREDSKLTVMEERLHSRQCRLAQQH